MRSREGEAYLLGILAQRDEADAVRRSYLLSSLKHAVYYVCTPAFDIHPVLLIYFSVGLCLFRHVLSHRNTIESIEISRNTTSRTGPIVNVPSLNKPITILINCVVVIAPFIAGQS